MDVGAKDPWRGASGSGDAMVMGDLVLVEDEVGPVMAALQEGGVEQTALHNHVLRESPRVMYMHIMAHGNQAKIATAIRSALGSSKTPVPQETTSPPAAPATPSTLDLDTETGPNDVSDPAGRTIRIERK